MKINFLIIILIVLILVSGFNIFMKIYNREKVTGYASGYVNIFINNAVIISLTRDSISWGQGMINVSNANCKNATLKTAQENAYATCGNWTNSSAKGLIIQNLGNLNCSLFIKTEKNAHDFFESASSSNEEYKINVSNKYADSCSQGVLNQWIDANKTNGGTKYCEQFDFNPSKNELYIDVLLTIPGDSNKIGEQSDTITVIGDAAG
jgi:hypothetical protein